MHELGIVIHTAKTLQQFAQENGIEQIQTVTLRVGEVSGILSDEFIHCWNYFRKRYPVLEEAGLRLEIEKAETWCDSCKRIYPTVEYGRTCPWCKSEKTWLLHGRDVTIQEIEVPEDETEE